MRVRRTSGSARAEAPACGTAMLVLARSASHCPVGAYRDGCIDREDDAVWMRTVTREMRTRGGDGRRTARIEKWIKLRKVRLSKIGRLARASTTSSASTWTPCQAHHHSSRRSTSLTPTPHIRTVVLRCGMIHPMHLIGLHPPLISDQPPRAPSSGSHPTAPTASTRPASARPFTSCRRAPPRAPCRRL